MLPEVASDRKQAGDESAQKASDGVERGPTAPVSQNQQRRPRAGTKLAQLVALLEREGGTTIEEAAATLEWAQHTVRGVMSGALAKRFGLRIVSEPIEGRGRVYRAEGDPAADADKARSTGK
jgi:hypothetical protein